MDEYNLYIYTSVAVFSLSESVLPSSNDMAAILFLAPAGSSRDLAAILLSADAVFCFEPGLLSRVDLWLEGYSEASPSSLLQFTETIEITEFRLFSPRIGRRAILNKNIVNYPSKERPGVRGFTPLGVYMYDMKTKVSRRAIKSACTVTIQYRL